MNLTGLTLGLFMLLVIGFGFLWVVKMEYYLGAGIWKAVLVAGLLICLSSLWMPSFTASAILGIFGGSLVWGAIELPAQADRVRQGLFPDKPGRKE